MSGPGSGTGFPTFVNAYLPPGVLGDYAGANIRANTVAGNGAFSASPGGVSVGVAAWANPNTGIASTYYQPSSFAGFIHRDQQALMTTFLAVSGTQIPGGFETTVMAQGDFWGFFAASATAGQKVYANPVTGALTSAATGSSVTASNTSVTITALGAMTLVGSTTGAVAIGQIVVQAGQAPGLYITGGSGTAWTVANLDGTPIAAVTTTAASFYGVQETQFYVASPVVADCLFTAALAVPAAGTAFGVLTVSAISSGTLAAGQWISATGLPGSANIQILEQLTGSAGSTGTYQTNNVSYTISSTSTFDATAGKLGKISTWANWL